jgi:hypothetical protein
VGRRTAAAVTIQNTAISVSLAMVTLLASEDGEARAAQASLPYGDAIRRRHTATPYGVATKQALAFPTIGAM